MWQIKVFFFWGSRHHPWDNMHSPETLWIDFADSLMLDKQSILVQWVDKGIAGTFNVLDTTVWP